VTAITLELDEEALRYLRALGKSCAVGGNGTVEDVLYHLASSAVGGVRRPGSWERSWLTSAFSDDWTKGLLPHPTVPYYEIPNEEQGWYFELVDLRCSETAGDSETRVVEMLADRSTLHARTPAPAGYRWRINIVRADRREEARWVLDEGLEDDGDPDAQGGPFDALEQARAEAEKARDAEERDSLQRHMLDVLSDRVVQIQGAWFFADGAEVRVCHARSFEEAGEILGAGPDHVIGYFESEAAARARHAEYCAAGLLFGAATPPAGGAR
jgi:hypothetical protein